MFESGFTTLFRAVERIRHQLKTADADLRRLLSEELQGLRMLGAQYFDHWLALDEQIHELVEQFQLDAASLKPAHAAPNVPVKHSILLKQPGPPSSPRPRTGNDATIRFRGVPEPEGVMLDLAMYDMTNQAEVSLRKGMGYYELLMFDEASDLLEQSVRQVDQPAARLFLAASCAAMNQREAALFHLEAVRMMTKDLRICCAAREIEAHLHLAENEVEGAIRCYLDITTTIADYQDAWYNLGLCYLAANEPIAAERVFRQAIRKNPTDAEAIVWLAYAVWMQNNPASALEICLGAIKKFPRHLGLLKMLSSICQVQNETTLGEDISRRIVYVAPTDPIGYLHAAWYALKTENFNRSSLLLKKLLSIHPNHAQGLLQLGITALFSSDINLAQSVLQFVDNLGKSGPLVWISLARLYAEQNQRDAAYLYLKRACAARDRRIKRLALFYYGQCLIEDKLYKEAEQYLRAADVMGAPNAAILLALSETSNHLGHTQKANMYREKAQLIQGMCETPV